MTTLSTENRPNNTPILQQYQAVGDSFVSTEERNFSLVASAICALIIGPLVTSAPSGYLVDSRVTWYWLAALGDSHKALLPGVFSFNTYPNVVNGSLWTIRYELMVYLVLVGMGVVFGCRNLGRVYFSLMIFGLVLWFWSVSIGAARLPFFDRLDVDLLPDRIGYLAGYFFSGAALWCWRLYLVRRLRWAVVACLGLLLADSHESWMVLSILLLPYIVVTLAERLPAAARGWRIDISYGIYVYGFVSQKVAVYLGSRLHWNVALIVVVCFALTLILAVLSWFCVERPALVHARRWCRVSSIGGS